MFLKKLILQPFSQPLTIKSLLHLLGLVTAVALLAGTTWGLVEWMNSGFQAPWRVKRTVFSYLKKQSKFTQFKANYEFDLPEKLTRMRADLGLLRTNLTLIQSNLTDLHQETRRLTTQAQTLVTQERALRQSLLTATNDWLEHQRRLTRRADELAAAQASAARAETNYTMGQQELTTLQTSSQTLSNDLQSLQARLGALQTNSSLLQSNLAALAADSKAKAREAAAKQRQASELRKDLESKQQRLLVKTNDANLISLTASLQTNLAGLLAQVTELQTTVTNLDAQAAVRQQEATALHKEIASLQKDLAAKQQECNVARRALGTKATDLAARLKNLESLRASFNAAQTNVSLLRANLAAAEADLETKRRALAAKQQEIVAQKAAATAKQKELEARQAELAAKQKEAQELQKTIVAKDQELANQHGLFVRDIRRQVADAASYEAIYKAIGQELWVAEQLLDSPDTNKQRAALHLAVEASQHAADAAENGWLAARICEAYLWPNLALSLPPDRSGQGAEQLLQFCGNVFQRAEDYPHLLRNLELTLDYTTNDVRADATRFSLAYTLEQTSNFDDALKWYRQIKTTNYLKQAEDRMLLTEDKRRARLPKPKLASK